MSIPKNCNECPMTRNCVCLYGKKGCHFEKERNWLWRLLDTMRKTK